MCSHRTCTKTCFRFSPRSDRFAFFFRSSRARTDDAYDFSLAEAARASSAAPTYFEPVAVTDAAGVRTYPLIDGGVYAVNPAMCAYVEVADAPSELEVLASLGTGSQTKAYDILDSIPLRIPSRKCHIRRIDNRSCRLADLCWR